MTKPQVVDTETVLAIEPWMEVLPMVKTTDDAANDMIAAILSADTLDSVLAQSEAVGIDAVLGMNLTLRGASLRESDLEEGYPVYAVIDAVDMATGERITITTGGKKVLAQLCKFQMMGAWPVQVRPIAIQSKSNAKRQVFQFVAADVADDY